MCRQCSQPSMKPCIEKLARTTGVDPDSAAVAGPGGAGCCEGESDEGCDMNGARC